MVQRIRFDTAWTSSAVRPQKSLFLHMALLVPALLLVIAVHAAWGVSAPYPPSTFILDLDWHETLNFGTDCDNWPTTWADDNNVYTSGGDGTGFGGADGSWIIRLGGTPPTITGQNITRYEVAEGPAGIKGSGIICVAGTLYMWARNADGAGSEAKLGWSTNHGSTWTWGPTFPLLGYPAFLNFGKNNAGARDSYVYTVSHDDPNAYTPSNRFILLRVPATSLTNMSAYQYFVGMNGSNPVWSSNASQRGAVFTHANGGEGRCARSQISYHAAVGRYLWWQQYPNDGGDTHTTYEGGFGIYDAPEPWGPWTTVYFTTDWDQGPGETGGFCTKYTSTNGNTLWLVFSGNDSLRMRRATITRGTVDAPVIEASALLPMTAFPNPFTSDVRTEFRLAGPSAVRIDVRDVHGRPVIELLNRVLGDGVHSVAWNGQDAGGRRVAAGVYFVRLDAGGDVQSRRIVHLR